MMHLVFIFLNIFFHQVCIEAAHDLHLSKTDVIYNHETKSIEITMKIFIDDLEAALALRGHDNLKILTDSEDPAAEDYINEYLHDKITLSTGGQVLSFDYLGKEVNEDLSSAWCYMEVVTPQLSSDITVFIDLFNEMYDDQKNVLKLQYDDQYKDHFLLSKNETRASIPTL